MGRFVAPSADCVFLLQAPVVPNARRGPCPFLCPLSEHTCLCFAVVPDSHVACAANPASGPNGPEVPCRPSRAVLRPRWRLLPSQRPGSRSAMVSAHGGAQITAPGAVPGRSRHVGAAYWLDLGRVFTPGWLVRGPTPSRSHFAPSICAILYVFFRAWRSAAGSPPGTANLSRPWNTMLSQSVQKWARVRVARRASATRPPRLGPPSARR